MERNRKIFMQSWLQVHPRTKPVFTDEWYLNFANRLFSLIGSSRLYAGKGVEEVRQAALTLTLYLEDCIANTGGWRRFCDWHHRQYGSYLPFYELSEDYFPDEINESDVAFVLWMLNSKEGFAATVANPFDANLLELAGEVYRLMDGMFEQAPITDFSSDDWVLPSEQMQVERTVIPEITPTTPLPDSVKRFLEASHGEQLMYFPLYEQMTDFFVEHLDWNRADMPDKQDEGDDNVVVFANPKGILVAPGIARLFCDVRNEAIYDESRAVAEGYKVFTDKGYCPFDLLKHAMEQNLFPAAQLPFENGKEILEKNWDFIARYFLGEYYEGR